MNILFTNAGRRTYLIEYALDLKKLGYDIKVFVCDTSLSTAAMHVSPNVTTFITPRVIRAEDKYLDVLFQYCLKNKIELIIPLMDFELPVLSKNKGSFENAGIKVWVSDYSVIMNCLNKKKNLAFCKKNNILTPTSFFDVKAIKYPAIKKKIEGSGSVGLEIFKKQPEFLTFIEGEDMIQELIQGQEFGMDIFNDYNGNYIHSCFREKLLMRNGETDKARSFYDPEFEKEARHISTSFRHSGNMDVDLIVTPTGQKYFIDFNPRFGGGYPFSHLSGVNYIKYIIEDSMGYHPQVPSFHRNITGMKGIKVFWY